MKRVIAIFVFLGPFLGCLPFIFKLGPFIVFGLPFAYIFGLIPATIAAGLFIGLTSIQKRILHEPELTKSWAAILGVVAGVGGALISLLVEIVATGYQLGPDSLAFLLLPSIFAGAICGALTRNSINVSSIYFGRDSGLLRSRQESTCIDCACKNDVSSERCTCCGAVISKPTVAARTHASGVDDAPIFGR
jgi:hypothetical protein